jgi:hypothetical protein
VRKLLYSLVFMAFLVSALVVLMPARLIESTINQRLVTQRIPVALQCTTGNLLDGSALVQLSGTAFTHVYWRFVPSALLRGRAGFKLRLGESDATVASSCVTVAPNDLVGDATVMARTQSLLIEQIAVAANNNAVEQLLNAFALDKGAVRLTQPRAAASLQAINWIVTRERVGSGATLTVSELQLNQTGRTPLGTFVIQTEEPTNTQLLSATLKTVQATTLKADGAVAIETTGKGLLNMRLKPSDEPAKSTSLTATLDRAKIGAVLAMAGAANGKGEVVLRHEFAVR